MTDALFLLDTNHDNAPVLAAGIEEGWTIALPSQVKRHAISAMRLSEGDALQLSDGKGLRIHAKVTDVENGLVRVEAFTRKLRERLDLRLFKLWQKQGTMSKQLIWLRKLAWMK